MSGICNTLKVSEAAELLGVHRTTILEWITSGKIVAFRAGEGCMWFIPRDDLEKLFPNIVNLTLKDSKNARG